MRPLRLALIFCSISACGAVSAAAPAQACLRDLNALPAYLLANDTGAKDHLAQVGKAQLDAALARARAAAAKVRSDDECLKALNTYVKAWRPTHIGVSPAPKPAAAKAATAPARTPTPPAPEKLPRLLLPSERTAVLVLPSFSNEFREPLANLLTTQRAALESRSRWIIDVRNNDGGSDSTYAPLLPWIAAGRRVEIGAEFLATPANIAAHARVCDLFAPGDAECAKHIGELLPLLKSARPGTYVRPTDVPAMEIVEPDPAPGRRPTHVLVLIDRECYSSCEQFLLSVRQNFNVKLKGRRTAGSLDYSNVRPHPLPSGKRLLWYATSRSLRLPHLPVDVAGVIPDIYVPRAEGEDSDAELKRAVAWIENTPS